MSASPARPYGAPAQSWPWDETHHSTASLEEPGFAGAVAGAVLQLGFERRLHERRRAAAQQAEQPIELIWEDWIETEAARGHLAMDRWRRTRRS